MTSPLNWQDFLKQTGLPGDAICLHAINTQHALVKVTGSDAESFLHAQLSNSVTGLSEGEVRLAAWCNAKGRVWTLLRYWKDADCIILRMPADQVEDTLKRLQMFVMRSDVQLEALNWQALQFIGPDAKAQADFCNDSADSPTYCTPLPGAWPLQEVWSPQTLRSECPELSLNHISLPRILSGIPDVFANQREEWIPQMLNLDRLGGIDFKKGCYPGQEIVAKLHYKGGLKQRLISGRIDAITHSPLTGAGVTDSEGNKVGTIIDFCNLPEASWVLIVARLEVTGKPMHFESQAIMPIEFH